MIIIWKLFKVIARVRWSLISKCAFQDIFFSIFRNVSRLETVHLLFRIIIESFKQQISCIVWIKNWIELHYFFLASNTCANTNPVRWFKLLNSRCYTFHAWFPVYINHAFSLFPCTDLWRWWHQSSFPYTDVEKTTMNNFRRVGTAFSVDSRKPGPFSSSEATLARYFHVEIFRLVDESNTNQLRKSYRLLCVIGSEMNYLSSWKLHEATLTDQYGG